MVREIVFALLSVFAIFSAGPVFAQTTWGQVTGHVTMVDPTGFGNRSDNTEWAIAFQIDSTITSTPIQNCGAGSGTATLLYAPVAFLDSSTNPEAAHPAGNDRQMANAKAVLSTLQLALATGLNVKVSGFNSYIGGYCQVFWVQIVGY